MRTVPETLFPLDPVTVVVGHYGVGKTNFSLNLAFDAAERGQDVTLVDLDVVNPYFRSSDFDAQLEAKGIKRVNPVFAGSTLDSPSISGAVATVIEEARRNAASGQCVIIDAGGDDVGATALGRFAGNVAQGPYTMLYVVNRYRNLTQAPEEAAAVLREIEAKSHLKATGVVNNSHLKQETSEETILDSLAFAEETSRIVELPLVLSTVPNEYIDQKSTLISKNDGLQTVYAVQVYVRTPWGS